MPRVLVILVMVTAGLLGWGTRRAMPTGLALDQASTPACDCCTPDDDGACCCCCDTPSATEPTIHPLRCCCTSNPSPAESAPPVPLPSPAPRIAGLLPAPIWHAAHQPVPLREPADTQATRSMPPLCCVDRLALIGHRTT